MKSLCIYILFLIILPNSFIFNNIDKDNKKSNLRSSKKVDIILFSGKKVINSMSYLTGNQQFQIKAKLKGRAYVYILNLGTDKKLYEIFPSNKTIKQNPLQRGEHYFPSRDTVYQFVSNKGIEVFYIFICKNKIIALEKLLELISPKGYSIDKMDKKALDSISFYIPGGQGKGNFYYDKIVLLYSPRKSNRINNKMYNKAKEEIKASKNHKSK